MLGLKKTGRSGLDCGGWSALLWGVENIAEHRTVVGSMAEFVAYGGRNPVKWGDSLFRYGVI